MSKPLFPIIGKKKERDAEDFARQEQEKIQSYVKEIVEFLKSRDIPMRYLVVVLEFTSKFVKSKMNEKFQPILDEWNDKTLKDFYAEPDTKDSR